MPSPQIFSSRDAVDCPSPSYDAIIIGGGIFGLSIARALLGAGQSVLVVDKGMAGEGASYGLLGALMPHMPARWNRKKQFQFNALHGLSKVGVELENETGLSTGYARVGRVVPLSNQNLKGHSQIRSDEAEKVWRRDETGFFYQLYPHADYEGWLNPDCCPAGYAFDNFSARANPRLYCGAVKESVLMRGGHLLEMAEVATIEEAGHSASVKLCDGQSVSAATIVVAAGYQGFPMLERHLSWPDKLGQGVKGQSIMARVGQPDGLPVLYDRGIYVVPHDNGYCAIGSTSENEWTDGQSTDHQCDEMWQKALHLCPMLQDAEIVTKWAGVRPKTAQRDPMVGYLPGSRSVFVATGGFKISYGIAHRIAQVAMERITDADANTELPETFETSHHLRRDL